MIKGRVRELLHVYNGDMRPVRRSPAPGTPAAWPELLTNDAKIETQGPGADLARHHPRRGRLCLSERGELQGYRRLIEAKHVCP